MFYMAYKDAGSAIAQACVERVKDDFAGVGTRRSLAFHVINFIRSEPLINETTGVGGGRI